MQRLNLLPVSLFHLCAYMTMLLVHLPAQEFKGIRSGFLAEFWLHLGYFKWVSCKQYFLLSFILCFFHFFFSHQRVQCIVFFCVLGVFLFFPFTLIYLLCCSLSLLCAYLHFLSLTLLVQPPPEHWLIRMAGKAPFLAGSKHPFKKVKLIYRAELWRQ